LAELAVVIGLVGILALVVPQLVWQGAQGLALLPRAQAAGRVASELMHAIVERSPSSLTGAWVPGLRYATRQPSSPGVALEPAIWLAEPDRLGYLVSHDPATPADNQYLVLWLASDQIFRCQVPSNACSLPPCAEEPLPYETAEGLVRVIAPGPVFRYYTSGDVELIPPGCAAGTLIRRVDLSVAVQTGGGLFELGDARIDVRSSVAIRFP
jgi:hypothetical protein